MPNAPSFAANPNLEHVLEVGYQMIQDGVVVSQGGGFDNNVPLRVEGINGYTERGFRDINNQDTTIRYASLLPGGVAGLNVRLRRQCRDAVSPNWPMIWRSS